MGQHLKTYTDILGQSLNIGDYIIYGAVDGRSGVIRIGRITELTKGRGALYDKEALKIKCKAVESGWGLGLRPLSREISLEYFLRICKIPKEIVPENVMELLK